MSAETKLSEAVGLFEGNPFYRKLSYSRLHCMECCPQQHYYRYIHRDKKLFRGEERKAKETVMGLEAHALMESVVKKYMATEGSHKERVEETKNHFVNYTNYLYSKSKYGACYEDDIDNLNSVFWKVCAKLEIATEVFPEFVIGVHKGGSARSYERWGCFTSDVIYGAIVDLFVNYGKEASIIDYKMENYSEERVHLTEFQTALYSSAVFRRNPEIEKITTSVIFLKDGDEVNLKEISRSDTGELDDFIGSKFLEYYSKCKNEERKAVAGPHCKWCPLKVEVCRYAGKER